MNDINRKIYPGKYRAAATISFDYETNIISTPLTYKIKFKREILKISNKFGLTNKIISADDYRNGALLAFNLLSKYKFHATWFGIGHTLLKDNLKGNEYRINQKLKYSTKETTYRTKHNTFYNEPFSDYISYPLYYFGDITKDFYDKGEDIQSHSFSHPFMALEPDENIKLDIEDWQNAAVKLGFEPAEIFAFPFLSDCYYYYPDINEIYCNKWENKGRFEIIPIDNKKLKILFSNGIRLVTRSEYYSNEKPFKGIKKYLNSELYYVHSRSIKLNLFTEDNLCKFLDEMIKNEWMVDFWCHNWEVAEYPDKFEIFLKILGKYKNYIWIPTLKEFWEYQENIM